MAVKRNVLVGLCAVAVLGLCVLAGAAKGGAVSKNAAADAYKLRLQGKADDARALLEQVIQENPRNAAAQYELARTNCYMVLHPDQQSGEKRLAEAQKSIEKAIESDPNNVIYHFFEGHVALLQAYPSWMQDQPDTREKMGRVCEAYESVLKLKPDFCQAMLYLVEIYGTLPEDKGGDKSKAEQYAKKLEAMDKVFGAKARWILQPKDANRVEYWEKAMKNNEGNTDVLEEMGKAYLSTDNVNDAVSCFEKAIKTDPEKSYLFLDLSIYHTWAAMKARDNAELRQKAITAGQAAVARYLDSKPVLPMQAYALGVQYRYKSRSEHKEGADELLKKAKELDPYFSMAIGSPNPDLFIAVDEIPRSHRYLFRPVQ